MKNYKEMTYRYLKGQKNRTLLTIIGIILSVALVTAIGTMIISVRGALIKEAMRESGSFHTSFIDIDRQTKDKVINHVDVDEYGISKDVGSIPIKETTEIERDNYGTDIPYRYIEVSEYDKNAIDMNPINIKEGRLPETPDEIAIEYWVLDYFDKEIKLGDMISFPVGERLVMEDDSTEQMTKETFKKTGEKQFKLVGLTEPRYVWRGLLVTQGITGFDHTNDDGDYNIYFKLDNVKNAYEKVQSIAEDVGLSEKHISYNNNLLRLSAESINSKLNNSLGALILFIVILIVVSTVAVIYNAFNISVIERISQFGLLRSIGATPNQIKGIIFKEAAILSVIAIPLGLFSGVFAMKVVLWVIAGISADVVLFKDMTIMISPIVFLISSVVGVFTVFLSARGPARRAAKISPLEAVRNIEDIKKEKIKRTKNTSIIRKILGIEGEISYKNLNRNKKRFVITVFSMVLSIALFITFSTFSDFMFKSGIVHSGERTDFQLYGNVAEKEEDIYQKLKKDENIERVYKLKGTNGEVVLNPSKINKTMIDLAPYMFPENEDGDIQVPNVRIYTIGDENLEVLEDLLVQGTVDIDKLNKENGVLVINHTKATKENSNSRVLMKGYNLKVGDEIPFFSYSHEDEENNYKDIKVLGVLEKGILSTEYNENGSINIITTEKVFKEVYEREDSLDKYITMYIQKSEDGDKDKIVELLKEINKEDPGLNFIDYAKMAEENRNMSIIMSIFLYGFVAIISIISSINIINTISTNIILRTREISMVKAVGMTNRGIEKMIAFEGIFYGIYASIFGGIIGVGLSYILFRIVGGISEFEYQLPWQNVLIACLGAILIALLSGVYPLKRINDKIIVENMKKEN